VNKHTIVYVGGQHDYHTLKGFRQAILDYGKTIGLPELKSEHYSEEVIPGAVLDEAMSLSSFGSTPSKQRQNLLGLLGRGADVHVLGLGRVDSVLGVLNVESSPRALRLKASNAASPISTSSGTIPRSTPAYAS
jgi:hypothetical protein